MRFEVELADGGTEYLVRIPQPRGTEPVTATLNIAFGDIVERVNRLERGLVKSTPPADAPRPTAQEVMLRQLGGDLFRGLFHGAIEHEYRNAQDEASRRSITLSLVLRISAPELAAIPWEALYDEKLRQYVCRRHPMVRQIEPPLTSPSTLPIEPPLKILGVIASPSDLEWLDVDKETAHLNAALDGPNADLIAVHWLKQASWTTLHRELVHGEWHIVHFIGHGDYHPATAEGRIALTRADTGRAEWVGASALADLVRDATPSPRLVVLNSCSSARSGTDDLFSSTAATLVHSGIPAVVAMQYPVSDDAAVTFPRGFYASIANRRRTIDDAVKSARVDMLNTGSGEWISPVVYVGKDSASLFEMSPPTIVDNAVYGDRSPVVDDRLFLQSEPSYEFKLGCGPVVDLAWDATQPRFAVASAHGRAIMFDLHVDRNRPAAAEVRKKLELKTRAAIVPFSLSCVALSADGARLAAGASPGGPLRIWDTATGAQLKKFGHTPAVRAAFSPDGATIATSTRWTLAPGRIRSHLWSADDGKQLFELDGGGTITFDPSGERLATVRMMKQYSVATIYDVASGQRLFDLGHDETGMNSIRFSPDGLRLATGGWDGSARIWDGATSQILLELPHPAGVGSVAFSPDGSLLATGCVDTVRVWNAVSGELLLTYRADERRTYLPRMIRVSFSPNGRYLASITGLSDLLRVWRVSTAPAADD